VYTTVSPEIAPAPPVMVSPGGIDDKLEATYNNASRETSLAVQVGAGVNVPVHWCVNVSDPDNVPPPP
jgi:hypothetical protein